MRRWVLPLVAGAAAVVLVASSVTAVVQWQRARDAEAELAGLHAEVADLRAEVERLEDELAAALSAGRDDPRGDAEDPPGGVFDDLFGDLSDLLAGSSGAIPGAACLVPDPSGGFGGLFDGLLDGDSQVPDDPDELVALIADQVAEMRELAWRDAVEVDFLDGEAVRSRLDDLVTAEVDRDAIDVDERLLTALGAIPATTDLVELQRELLGDAVAGFYVPETGELVVRVPGDGVIRPVDRVTLAHELEHALADQALGLPDVEGLDDADARLAALAVVEGDATLLMNLYALEHLSLMDQLGMLTATDIVAAQAALDDAPHFVQRQLLFPYTDGLEYVCRRYLAGGWAAVDAAYHDDRPQTSAEIVFPERTGEPPVDTATLSGPAGFREARIDTLGLAHLLWLFEAPGGDSDRALSAPLERAAAWAGGEVTVWVDGDATAVGVALVDGGDRPAPLCGSVTDWYGTTFPDAERSTAEGATVFERADAAAVIACAGTDVLLGIAPDLTAATTIVGAG